MCKQTTMVFGFLYQSEEGWGPFERSYDIDLALSSSSRQFEDLFEGFSRGLLERARRHSLPQSLRHRRCLVVYIVRGIHPRDHLRKIQISQTDDRRTTLIPSATPATCLSLSASAGSDARQRGHPPLWRHHVGDVRALLAHPASAGRRPRRALDLGRGGRGGGRSRRRGGARRCTVPKMTRRRGGHGKFRDPTMYHR